MTGDDVCFRCGEGIEDVDHVLRFCKYAKEAWSCLLPSTKLQKSAQLSLHEWMLQNLLDKRRSGLDKESWACLFGLTCWKLWTARNLVVFENKQTSVASLIRKVVVYARFNDQRRHSTGGLLGGCEYRSKPGWDPERSDEYC
ncbi:hypothetical protein K1719_015948 [Acacia pycnantha]|nr:hypothetical protein K1719_015948 [Acacia pycnantha]